MEQPAIVIVDQRIDRSELARLPSAFFEDMVKYVVDVERSIAAVGGELHADARLLETGSRLVDLWGVNYYPGRGRDACIEFTSLIALHPHRRGRSPSSSADGGSDPAGPAPVRDPGRARSRLSGPARAVADSLQPAARDVDADALGGRRGCVAKPAPVGWQGPRRGDVPDVLRCGERRVRRARRELRAMDAVPCVRSPCPSWLTDRALSEP